MARDSQRTLEVLEEIAASPNVTQRSMSERLGISLGMANLYLKRLARKGYIKITTVPGKRLLRYMLTPKGFSAKTRLTYEFAEYSYRFLRNARRHMFKELQQLSESGIESVVMCGTGELAELTYIAMVEAHLSLTAVCSNADRGKRCLGREVLPLEALADLDYDGVLVFSESDRSIVEKLIKTGTRVAMLAPEPI